jgi:hypothetical protein
MENSHHTHAHREHKEDHDGPFYKGLFWGLVAGVGLALFLNSSAGKEIVNKAKKRLDSALAELENIEDEEDPLEITSSSPEPSIPEFESKK